MSNAKVLNYINDDYYRASFFLEKIFDDYLYDKLIFILGLGKNLIINFFIDYCAIIIEVLSEKSCLIYRHKIEYDIDHYFQTTLETIIRFNLFIKFSNQYVFIKHNSCFYSYDNYGSLTNYDDGEIYADFTIYLNYDYLQNIKSNIFSNLADQLQIPIILKYFQKLKIEKKLFQLIVEYDPIIEFIKLNYINEKQLSLEQKVNCAYNDNHINKKQLLKLNKILSYK